MMEIGPVATWGIIKAQSPLKLFFHTLSFFFPSYRFSKRWLHTLTKGFTWARKGKRKRKSKGREKKEQERDRKGRGKGEERERKGKNRAVSHTDRFWCQKLSVSFSFCYRSWILCTFLFSGNGCNHQKRTVATTYAFVGAPLRQQTMKWRNQKH